jgi:hypothetical protein
MTSSVLNFQNQPENDRTMSEELNDLRIARGSVVHSGIGIEKMSTFRVREIVVDYVKALLTVIQVYLETPLKTLTHAIKRFPEL